MSAAHILGFPRIGARRRTENGGRILLERKDQPGRPADGWTQIARTPLGTAARGRADYVTVGDFAWYDHLHNATALFTSAPARFGFKEPIDVAGYFAMARGTRDAPALAMRKWFDTNYHYLVPEFD